MKKLLALPMLAILLASNPAFAEADQSPGQICRDEATDAGIEDSQERKAYIDECVEQIQADNASAGGGEAGAGDANTDRSE